MIVFILVLQISWDIFAVNWERYSNHSELRIIINILLLSLVKDFTSGLSKEVVEFIVAEEEIEFVEKLSSVSELRVILHKLGISDNLVSY